MQLYFAPMEGITGLIYRRAHHRVFGEGVIDKYFSPFIFTNPHGRLSKRDIVEMDWEANSAYKLVPQLLSNVSADFIATAKTLKSMGYTEININLGCPSITVAVRGKRGAGFLAYPDELESFLDAVYQALYGVIDVSIKTRTGMYHAAEFDKLLDIYSRFPLSELIVHPRVREDFYRGTPDFNAFDKAVDKYRQVDDKLVSHKLVYNGNIFTVRDFEDMQQRCPGIHRWMMGRGLLTNPGLAGELRGLDRVNPYQLADFYNELKDGYYRELGGSIKAVNLLKQFWRYIVFILSDEDAVRVDELIHTSDREEFDKRAQMILDNCRII